MLGMTEVPRHQLTGGLIKYICTRILVRDFLELSFLPCSNKVVTKQTHFTLGPVNFCPQLVATYLVSQGQMQDIYPSLDGANQNQSEILSRLEFDEKN